MFRLIFSNLKKRWFLYFLALLSSFFAFHYGINKIIEPTNKEKIGILVVSSEFQVDYDAFVWPDYVKKMQTEELDSSSAQTVMDTRYLIHSFDVLIISEEDIGNYTNYYFRLDDEKIKETLGVFDYYQEEDDIFGIDITDCLQQFKGEELSKKYYLCFAKNSYHMGTFAKTSRNGAITLARYIIGK